MALKNSGRELIRAQSDCRFGSEKKSESERSESVLRVIYVYINTPSYQVINGLVEVPDAKCTANHTRQTGSPDGYRKGFFSPIF